jgi:hypothetical protein
MGRLAITSFNVREEHSVLKFGIGTRHYEYEQFIQELLNAKKQTNYISFLIKFCFLIDIKIVTTN